MTCGPDEFLLVLRKWVADSAAVNFSLWLNEDGPMPALSITWHGRVLAVDNAARSVMFHSSNADVIALHLDHWPTITYLDKDALPRIDTIKEGFSLRRPGTSINLVIQEPG